MKALFHNAYEVKEENGRYRPVRFSDKAIENLGRVRKCFGDTGKCTAGIVLAFYTDAEEISFSYEYTVLYTKTGGFDVYENGIMMKNHVLPEESCNGTFTYRKETCGETLIEIFLPSNAETILWDLKLGSFRPLPPSDGKLVVFYGDSITHSAYTQTPSLSYVPIAARLAGMRYLNRGVGSMFYDARALDDEDTADPDIIFTQFGGNDMLRHHPDGEVLYIDGVLQRYTVAEIPVLMENARQYIRKLMQIYPKAKINIVSMLWSGNVPTDEVLALRNAYREGLKALAEELSLDYIEALKLTPHILACHAADKGHLNALGGVMAGKSYAEILKKM